MATDGDRTPRPPFDQSRELIGLIETVRAADAQREARIAEKLAELDTFLEESARLQRLITGGAARREARLRHLEDQVEQLADRFEASIPRPLDIPPRVSRFDASVVDMHPVDPEPEPSC
jgi:hypothetical protein